MCIEHCKMTTVIHQHVVPKVVIFCKTSKVASGGNTYHAGGLASNALHTVGVLRRLGVDASVQLVAGFDDLKQYMAFNPGVTHAIIEAVWVTPVQVKLLSNIHQQTMFVVRAHSKIGFLQVEPEAIPIIRGIIKLSETQKNVAFSSNNEEFCDALEEVYGKCVYVPNLYDLDESPPRDASPHAALRIASFGATRLLKLHPNAALASLQIAARLHRPLEFYINKDKTPGGESVRNTIRNLLNGLPDVSLVEVDWQDASSFKETIAKMDLVIQLSCTETFCLVAADAVASGVPVTTGPAITWLSTKHQTNIDDTSKVAELGIRALTHSNVVKSQRRCLEKFINDSIDEWMLLLGLPKRRRWWHVFW